jgi:dihydrofolate reductase
MPLISLIVAASTNHVIGVDGQLPWHLRDDLQHFKAITTGKPVVMGRKTHASIGRPLPGRHNIVMTRRPDFEAPGCTVVSSKQEALAAAGDADEVMVIGGGEIYAAFRPDAGRVYLTRVHAEVAGDATFAELDPRKWQLVAEKKHAADEANDHAFTMQCFERRDQPPSASASRSANS